MEQVKVRAPGPFGVMQSLRRMVVLVVFAFGVLGLVSCGSDGEVATESAAPTEDDESAIAADEDDHGDDEDDHGDDEDEHGDEDDHGDEDEDEDHHDDEDDHDDHDDDASGGLDAHVHGTAELFVASSDGAVVIDLMSPTINIFGFEYEPETDDDKALAAERTEALTKADIMSLNPEAGCELTTDVEPQVEYEGSHAELTAGWLFECTNPEEISSLDLSELFAEFPGIVDLDAQWASDQTQSAAELSSSSAVLRLE